MRTILFIERSPNLAEAFTKYLSKSGFDVRTARGCEQAVERCRRKSPDIAIIDTAITTSAKSELVSGLRDTCGELPVLWVSRNRELKAPSEPELDGPSLHLNCPIGGSELVTALNILFEAVDENKGVYNEGYESAQA